MLDLIPAERREGARSALTAAFGEAPITGLEQLTGGVSALIYRVEVAGRPHLLRLERGRDMMRNPERGYACMNAAADAGLAPAVRHADPAAGVAIMAFIEQRPLETYPGGPQRLAEDLGALVARLQATPAFPPFGDYQRMVAGLLAMLRNSSAFAPGLLDPHAEAFERLRTAYPWNAEAPVSAHNDLNPRNILFDGTRLWLIDWELAFRNDPFVDVALLANELAATPELRMALLRGWLGREPDRAERARLVLMRQFTRLFYAGLIVSAFAAAGGASPAADLSALTPCAFREAVAAGRIAPGSPEAGRMMGKMFLAAFLADMGSPEVLEALALAGAG